MPVHYLLNLYEADGSAQAFRLEAGEYLAGRDPETCQILAEAEDVSRRHARLVLSENEITVEDLGSTAGTAVDGVLLDARETFVLPQTLQLGRVRIEVDLEGNDQTAITHRASPEGANPITPDGITDRTYRRLSLLYDLPLQFARETDLERLCQAILESVMGVIDGAVRGALLTFEPASGKLALRASIPEDQPPISRTLIRRAAYEQEGFIWIMDEAHQGSVTDSMVRHRIHGGMYSPLLWRGKVVGVIGVDNPAQGKAFGPDDLAFLNAVANYAAAAMANLMLVDEIAENNRTLGHLLTNFSPKVRQTLLDRARQGKLQPGGETSEVTILLSDFRGFTKTTAGMAPEFVVQMLNDYFSSLAEVVFAHGGTIDKFIGDAILAVFGSPEPDPDHARNAARCALAMQESVSQINARRLRKGLVRCELGIGVHSGEVLHGFIGAADRLEFTVIGETVNLATRYCDCAQAGQVAVSPETFRRLGAEANGVPASLPVKHTGNLDAFLLQAVG